MDVGLRNLSNATASSSDEPGQESKLTPELVRKITDMVYAMMLEELRIEHERHRPELSGGSNAKGGYGWLH